MFTRAVTRLGRKRPPSEIHTGESPLNAQDNEQKGTRKWATSLESLLDDPKGVAEFIDFLKKEFSEENLLFWLACEDFKKTRDKDQMLKKAHDIYTTFLSSKASTQVNVEGQSKISEKMLEEPHPLMFQKHQDQIFNLMKYDSYSRFLKSETFLKLKTKEENESSASSAGESVPKRASRIYNT
ncbi:regulator of G-protein signaling 10 L homeolog [Xenopus laevis]|nr:regulator of G-protein signaling 10 L homeolog [Xenopus laevis]AAH72967.1 MGC82511 protein [Xenopus laevis]